MKKLFFVLLSVMAIALTGCKFDNATVTVTVMEKYEDPVPNRYVLYQDKVSAILDLVGPLTPEEIVEGVEDSNWDYVKTDKYGTVTFKIVMGVSSLNYYFYVYDEGAKKWLSKEVSVKRGGTTEVDFVVNQ